MLKFFENLFTTFYWSFEVVEKNTSQTNSFLPLSSGKKFAPKFHPEGVEAGPPAFSNHSLFLLNKLNKIKKTESKGSLYLI